jgi:hypothetical protein
MLGSLLYVDGQQDDEELPEVNKRQVSDQIVK